MKRYRRKKRNNKFYTYLLFFVFIAIAFICFTRSSLFDVSNVYVEGADSVSASEVLELSGIKAGENIFSFKASAAEKAIKTIPMVKNASVVRVYPSNVKIIITERTAVMAFSVNNRYYALDDEGMVLCESDNFNNSFGIVISGFRDLEIIPGAFFDFGSTAATMTVYETLTWFKSSGNLNNISEIYCSPSGYYYVYTKKSSVIKFYSLKSFEANTDFIDSFVKKEDRHIMVEVIEESVPVYKVIDIQ